MPNLIRTVKVVVTGRVQGVWYRAWTCEQAKSRGLDGWVRNRHDGGVEAVLSGPDREVNAMLELLWHGPVAASVASVQSQALNEPPDPGFHQRKTV